MSSKSLRSITRMPLSEKEYIDSALQARNVDDRSCVIILSALLEYELEHFLRKKMITLADDAYNKLFMGSGPLSSFSGKLRIARAFGLLGPKTSHDFETLNDIRNAFAHSARRVTFRNKRVLNRLSGLHAFTPAAMIGEAMARFEDSSAEDKKFFPTMKGKYLLCIGAYHLCFRAIRLNKRKSLKAARGMLRN